MSASEAQSPVSKVICTICGQPIERRRELLIKWNGMFKMEPTHYQCFADMNFQAGKHWNRIEMDALNSGVAKIFLVLLNFIILLFVVSGAISGHDSIYVPAAGVFVVIQMITLKIVLGYFKFEHKVPK